VFVTKKQFNKFKKNLERQLWNNEEPLTGRCYYREILNLKDQINSIEKQLEEFFGKYHDTVFLLNSNGDLINDPEIRGVFYELLDYLNIEYKSEKGFRKKKKK